MHVMMPANVRWSLAADVSKKCLFLVTSRD